MIISKKMFWWLFLSWIPELQQSSCYLRGFTVSGPTALPLKYLFMALYVSVQADLLHDTD